MFRIFSIVFISVFSLKLFSQNTFNERPALVIGIVVDQMRYDYLARYWDKFSEGGFKRLIAEGFDCNNTQFNYIPTYTGPGHASIYTGTYPAVHGIVGNNWYHRSAQEVVYCVDDKNARGVGGSDKSGAKSPKTLFSTTITDELRIATNFNSRVYGVALKDRSAILPAGHSANAAYWFDNETGHFITSNYYMNELPKWVNDFNKQKLSEKYLSKPWNTLLPIHEYTESATDDNPYEGLFKGQQKPIFPHRIDQFYKTEGFKILTQTPFGNSITKDFAMELLVKENLGKNGYTDFLAISFSSTDIVGHQFGPQSIELQDTYLRLDLDLKEIFEKLDAHVGKEKYLLFLTSDHGVAEVPEYAKANKIPAGNFTLNIKDTLNTLLKKKYGEEPVLYAINEQVYFKNPARVYSEKYGNDVIDFLQSFEGVAFAQKSTDLYTHSHTQKYKMLMQNGLMPQRSGDIVYQLQPGWISMGWQKKGTTHGSLYSYDTRVPLIWYGWNIAQGSSSKPVNITDIAPTLAVLLNINFPNGTTGSPIYFLKKGE